MMGKINPGPAPNLTQEHKDTATPDTAKPATATTPSQEQANIANPAPAPPHVKRRETLLANVTNAFQVKKSQTLLQHQLQHIYPPPVEKNKKKHLACKVC